MDEFQRFSSLIEDNPDDDSEQTLITRRFFKTMSEDNAPLILLLSATPYKPYTTLEELNEDNCDTHYEDFIKLGATDKPCGVRTVANPKLLLNGT